MNRRRLIPAPVVLAGLALVGASVLLPASADAGSQGAARSRSSHVSGSSGGSHRAPGGSGRGVVTRSDYRGAGSHSVSGHTTHRGYRGHSGYRGYRGYPGRTHYRPSIGLSFGLGYWGGYYNPYFWGYGYYPWGSYYGSRPYPARIYSAAVGAFDLNVKPKKTQVWVDGRYVGTAGKFDGFPDYLWLSEGDHQLVFYLEGYGTVERRVETLAGVVADLRIDMQRGQSTPPQEIATEPAYEYGSTLPPETARAPEPRTAPSGPARAVPQREIERETGDDEVLDARVEPARLVLRVEPADASVYLDGRFLGTGKVLSRLHAGLLVDSGEHVLEVVRPGYEDKSVRFSVVAGEEERLEIGLDSPS